MIRRVIRGTGKTLIASGVLILLFVVYQLWGTGLTHEREQRKLRSQFAAALATPTTTISAPSSTASTNTTAALALADECPQCAAIISIPKIGLDEVVVEGVEVPDLKKGVGHYPYTKLPGQPGNVAFAGHRTTYGAPFNRLDDLVEGDQIMVTTKSGTFRYDVMQKSIVTPDEVSVLDDTPDNRLTLTTCHPKYSAAQRLIIVAKLVTPPIELPESGGEAQAQPPRQLVSGAGQAGLSGADAANRPAIAWGIVAASVWLMAWAVGGWSGRRWISYGMALPVFLIALFMFFENFARLLPANI